MRHHPTPEQASGEQPLTVKEAAAFLGLSPLTIYGLVHERKLPAFKPTKKLLFFRSDLEGWIRQARIKTQTEITQLADQKIADRGKR